MTIETHTTWGREFTPEELVLFDKRKAKLLSEGVVLHPIMGNSENLIREWDTIELANGWVEFANSLNPPPVKVEIVIT
jgi:hypothetical protein